MDETHKGLQLRALHTNMQTERKGQSGVSSALFRHAYYPVNSVTDTQKKFIV